MKYACLVAFLLFLNTNGFSQQASAKYIQINATIDISGNIKFEQVENRINRKKVVKDTGGLNLTAVNNIIGKSKNAIDAINCLSTEGWNLITAVAFTKDDNDRPNSPFIAYYFRKD
jgi:hypothetical protein